MKRILRYVAKGLLLVLLCTTLFGCNFPYHVDTYRVTLRKTVEIKIEVSTISWTNYHGFVYVYYKDEEIGYLMFTDKTVLKSYFQDTASCQTILSSNGYQYQFEWGSVFVGSDGTVRCEMLSSDALFDS